MYWLLGSGTRFISDGSEAGALKYFAPEHPVKSRNAKTANNEIVKFICFNCALALALQAYV